MLSQALPSFPRRGMTAMRKLMQEFADQIRDQSINHLKDISKTDYMLFVLRQLKAG
jgi:hypothetical protein